MSSYYVSSYGGGGGGGEVVQADHYHGPAPVHGVSVATGHVVGGNVVHHAGLTGTFETGQYDPSRVYHIQQHHSQQQQQQQHHQHQQQMGQNFNQQQPYPASGRYPPTSGYIHQQHGKAAEAQTGGYFAAGQQQHIRSHPQQTAVIGPEATQQQQHLYRPASPMISAMAPQHGSPPLNYTGVVGKPLVPCDPSTTSTSPHSSSQQQLGNNLYGAGHPSFQAQHHRQVGTGQQQQQQHLLSHQQYLIQQQQQQQQHSIVQSDPTSYNINSSVEGYQPAEMFNQQQPNHSPVMYNNNRCASNANNMTNGNYNNNGCHGPMASSSSSSEPVIADLDQLQQQQRQQQQQHCSVKALANPVDNSQPNQQLHLHSNIQQTVESDQQQQTPQSQQQPSQRHPLLAPGLVITGPVPVTGPPQQTVVMSADEMHGDLHGDIHGDLHGDMMDHHLDLQQHSPLDGSGQLPPLMDGESPPGSLHDSPLYPWMRSQFGNFLLDVRSFLLIGLS